MIKKEKRSEKREREEKEGLREAEERGERGEESLVIGGGGSLPEPQVQVGDIGVAAQGTAEGCDVSSGQA